MRLSKTSCITVVSVCYICSITELCHEKTNNVVSEQVQHKLSTEDGQRLEILDLESREIAISM